jgi:putative sterol carrier protein
MDKDLVREVKEIIDAGASSASKESMGKVFDFIKAVSQENEDLKEELEDMDIKVQMVVTDEDIKYWLKASEGLIDYGEGEIDNPSFTFSATKEVAGGMLIGEVDATSAYMAGDITVEGNLQDAMAFQEILELAMEAFEDYAEDL